MHFLPENRMCAPPFVTKQRPPIWKILDPPLVDVAFAYDILSFKYICVPDLQRTVSMKPI